MNNPEFHTNITAAGNICMKDRKNSSQIIEKK